MTTPTRASVSSARAAQPWGEQIAALMAELNALGELVGGEALADPA